jgi:hypothetical protein
MTLAKHEAIAFARKCCHRMDGCIRHITYALVAPARALLLSGVRPDQVLDDLENIVETIAWLNKVENDQRHFVLSWPEFEKVSQVISTQALCSALITQLHPDDRPAWHDVFEEVLEDRPKPHAPGSPAFTYLQDMTDQAIQFNAEELLENWDRTPQGIRNLLMTLASGLLALENESDVLLDLAHTLEVVDFLERDVPGPDEQVKSILSRPEIRMILVVDALHFATVAELKPRHRWVWGEVDPLIKAG